MARRVMPSSNRKSKMPKLNAHSTQAPNTSANVRSVEPSKAARRTMFFNEMKDVTLSHFNEGASLDDIKAKAYDAMQGSPNRPANQTNEQLKSKVSEFVERELVGRVATRLHEQLSPAEQKQFEEIDTQVDQAQALMKENEAVINRGSPEEQGRLIKKIVSLFKPETISIALAALLPAVAAQTKAETREAKRGRKLLEGLRSEAKLVESGKSPSQAFSIITYTNGTRFPNGHGMSFGVHPDGDSRKAFLTTLEGIRVRSEVQGGFVSGYLTPSAPIEANSSACKYFGTLDSLVPKNQTEVKKVIEEMFNALCKFTFKQTGSMTEKLSKLEAYARTMGLFDVQGFLKHVAAFGTSAGPALIAQHSSAHGVTAGPGLAAQPISMIGSDDEVQSSFASHLPSTATMAIAAGAIGAVGLGLLFKAAYNKLTQQVDAPEDQAEGHQLADSPV